MIPLPVLRQKLCGVSFFPPLTMHLLDSKIRRSKPWADECADNLANSLLLIVLESLYRVIWEDKIL